MRLKHDKFHTKRSVIQQCNIFVSACVVPNITNGDILPRRTKIAEGSSLLLQCAANFFLSGKKNTSITIFCQKDGKFSHSSAGPSESLQKCYKSKSIILFILLLHEMHCFYIIIRLQLCKMNSICQLHLFFLFKSVLL